MSRTYFLTAFDPEYRIQGSRDPLGFQTIWTATGRRLIQYLSTVSTSLRDFKTLCLARHICMRSGDEKFVNFLPLLYRLEQACAYARYIVLKDTNFNGTERVGKWMSADSGNYLVSDIQEDNRFLLSNQRSYGVYGKYFRPFMDIGIDRDPQFGSVMDESLGNVPDPESLQRLLHRLYVKGARYRTRVSLHELKQLAAFLQKCLPGEKAFYNRKLLQVESEHSEQNAFYKLLRAHPKLLPYQTPKNDDLYTFISKARALATHDALQLALEEIEKTEQVLYPLQAIFAHFLHNQPVWSKEDIDADKFFLTGFAMLDYEFGAAENAVNIRQVLNAWLSDKLRPSERIRYLVARNEEVSLKRGKLPWVRRDGERFIILCKGLYPPLDINQQSGSSYSYFIPSYLRLFTEIVHGNAIARE